MAGINRFLGGAVVIDLHKPEASRLARKAVPHDRYRIHSDPCLSEEILDVGLIRAVRQISSKKLLHWSTPNCNWRRQDSRRGAGRRKPDERTESRLTLQVRGIVCQKALAESKRKTG